MVGKFGIVCALGVMMLGSMGSAQALGPVNPVARSSDVRSDLLDISFWGRPYPYGVTGWGPCIRYVEVETRWGLRLRRVRVCR
jgi:hypothetical protein